MFKSILLLLIVSSFIINCTDSVSDSGGASETVATLKVSNNEITGLLSKQDIYTIKVFNYTFTSFNDSSKTKYGDTLFSNAYGDFQVQIPKDGKYNLFIYDSFNKSVGFQSIQISDSTYTLIDTIKEYGTITGKINLPIDIFVDSFHISLTGTDIYTRSSSLDSFTLNNVPEGSYSIFTSIIDSDKNNIDSGNTFINKSETINNVLVTSGTNNKVDIIFQ